MIALAVGKACYAVTLHLCRGDLGFKEEGGASLFQHIYYPPLHYPIHAALHVVVAIVPELGV